MALATCQKCLKDEQVDAIVIYLLCLLASSLTPGEYICGATDGTGNTFRRDLTIDNGFFASFSPYSDTPYLVNGASVVIENTPPATDCPFFGPGSDMQLGVTYWVGNVTDQSDVDNNYRFQLFPSPLLAMLGVGSIYGLGDMDCSLTLTVINC